MLAKGIFVGIGAGDGPPETFNQIVNVTSFALSGTSWTLEDQTSHDNAVPVKQTQPTIRDEGKVSLILNPYVKGNAYHAALRALSVSGAANNFRITYPGSEMGSYDLSGFVTSFSFDTPVNGILKAKVDVTVNGALIDDAAQLQSVVVSDSQSGDYVTGEYMELTATFDEYVLVTGAPRIPVVLTSGTVYASYVSGSDTNILTFRTPNFGAGDVSQPGTVSITGAIAPYSGSTLLDLGGNVAVVTFTPPVLTGYKVNPVS